MRLVKLQADGSFSLVEITQSVVPQYAILSHTWGDDADELTLFDVTNGLGQQKSGFRKLVFCGEQALQDGLEYFWIDTCCIDKTSSAELTEAINSMFQWYQASAHCYVYLSDISTSDFVQHKQHIQDSKWFTRGWTLQELIAPKSVRFFTAEGTLLGSRKSLLQEIQIATGIDPRALAGEPLHRFSIETRMSWAEGRKTKRSEDAAYCLLGIFDVNLPLIYGEGRRKAFLRLQRELRDSMQFQEHLSHPEVSRLTLHGSDSEDVVTAHQTSFRVPKESKLSQQLPDATQQILDSLQYVGLEDRERQVQEAQMGTYGWILYPYEQKPNTFTDWLSSSTDIRRIFWIHGKPGSGKSTMMRYIKEHIAPDHLWPWKDGKIVLNAQYFFWNPGSEMQKSIVGLLRAILYQLLSQVRLHWPGMIPEIVGRRAWQVASTASSTVLNWTQMDLQDTLYSLLRLSQTSSVILLLIDGLDELDGTEDTREELLQFLLKVSGLANVKICLSSRPWNSFRDAFDDCPNLRLEDATQSDIELFIKAQLTSQPRFRLMLRHQRFGAEDLMHGISRRASGVFLWVRLVIRHLLVRIRDGDGVAKLQQQLDLIPDDLNCYLAQLFNTIPLDRHYEASVLLQIALYEEMDFATLHPLRLLDLSFIEAGQSDFLLHKGFKFQQNALTDQDSVVFRLDSTLRLLNSCCMGLLECHGVSDLQRSPDVVAEEKSTSLTTMSEASQNTDTTVVGQSDELPEDSPPGTQVDLFRASSMTVDFFHRTCRDFLTTPAVQNLLHNSSDGPYDARMFLLNARICQFFALQAIKRCHFQAINLASNILSSLARPSYREDAGCTRLAALFGPCFEDLMVNLNESSFSASYIFPSVKSWDAEKSSFLTLAIDFGLRSYVRKHLTTQHVREKSGRPILDYILRPRFPGMYEEIDIGNQTPNLEMISSVLAKGADPNQAYQSSSVWALFLCFMADLFAFHPTEEQDQVYTTALGLMIQAGAATFVPKSWLSAGTQYALYSYELFLSLPEGVQRSRNKRFSIRWPGALPAVNHVQDASSEPFYAVSDLLERFRPQLGSDIDELQLTLRHRDITGGIDG